MWIPGTGILLGPRREARGFPRLSSCPSRTPRRSIGRSRTSIRQDDILCTRDELKAPAAPIPVSDNANPNDCAGPDHTCCLERLEIPPWEVVNGSEVCRVEGEIKSPVLSPEPGER
jgi:hypothetical protein